MVLTGNRIVVKLDFHPQNTITASGLEVPHFDNYETDGGKLGTKISNVRYLAQGTIVHISPYAKELAAKEGTVLDEGVRVYVPHTTISPQYQFFLDRNAIVLDFDGHICVPHSLIEATL